MIKFQNIQHVSVSVTDVERSKDFYSTVLGLQEIDRPDFDFPGAWFGIGEQQLHLIQHPSAQTLRTEGGIDSKDGHFAVRITDFDGTVAHLKSLGISFRENRHSITGWNQIFLCDPDGNVIELNALRDK